MNKFQEEALNKLREVSNPIEVINIDFYRPVLKLLREWANQLESGQISVKKAVLTIDTTKSLELKNINIVSTVKKPNKRRHSDSFFVVASPSHKAARAPSVEAVEKILGS